MAGADLYAPITKEELHGVSQPDLYAPITHDEVKEVQPRSLKERVQAGIEGYENKRSFGFLPEATSVAQAVGSQGFNFTKPEWKNSYHQALDQNLARREDQKNLPEFQVGDALGAAYNDAPIIAAGGVAAPAAARGLIAVGKNPLVHAGLKYAGYSYLGHGIVKDIVNSVAGE